MAAFVDGYLAVEPTKALGGEGSMEDALCTPAKVTAILSEKIGPVIGYEGGMGETGLGRSNEKGRLLWKPPLVCIRMLIRLSYAGMRQRVRPNQLTTSSPPQAEEPQRQYRKGLYHQTEHSRDCGPGYQT